MFRVHMPIIRSTECWVAAYGFLNRLFGWAVVLRAVRMVLCTAPSAPYTQPTQQLSRPPPIQKLSAENHMLQPNIWCSWWWVYVPKTCRAKNTVIKLPCCIKLAFQIISCLWLSKCHRHSTIKHVIFYHTENFTWSFCWCYYILQDGTVSIEWLIPRQFHVSTSTLQHANIRWWFRYIWK